MVDIVKDLHANIKRLGKEIIFAHEVNVEDAIKVVKVDEKKSRKEGIMIMNFFDYPHAIPMARIGVTPATAKMLGKMLTDISKRMDKELDSKELKMIEQEKPETTIEHKGYLG